MTQKIENQVLALAGAAQFTLYAHDLANDGKVQPQRLERATQAIFCTDPDTAADVYGGRSGVADGIRYLRVHLSGQRPDAASAAIARYIGQILKLSGKLLGDEQALGLIQGAIDRAKLAADSDVPGIFDTAYRQTISPMKPQIMLHGDPTYLKNEYIQHRIRTQLLAAVRCGVMWQECGGGFFSLFFRRKALLAALG
jgi:high frequency lysogenization protein